MNYLRSVAGYFGPKGTPQQLISKNSSDTWEIICEENNPQRKESVQEEIREIPVGKEALAQREPTRYYMIENQFFNDVMVEKDEHLRVLQLDEWSTIIQNRSLGGFCRKNVIFSIMKGIPKEIRNNFWEILADTENMKKTLKCNYYQLIDTKTCKNIDIILKDVPRTQISLKYKVELTNILIAYSVLDPLGYTQGMNLICGSLLNILALKGTEEDTREGKEFEFDEIGFQERVFWVFVGIMYGKNWRECFDQMKGLQRMLKKLQELMQTHTPEVIKHIRDNQLDLNMCFAQYYLTLVIYNTPLQLATIILDLFLLEGERVIHSVILRMLIACRSKILSLNDMGQLVKFFKTGMLEYCNGQNQKQCKEAATLEDFILNFFTLSNQ